MPTFITLLFCLCAGIHALDLTFQLENTGVAFLDPSYSPNPERPASAAITLDRARTDVRIVEDDVTFRCGGLGDGAPEAPIFPEFNDCRLMSDTGIGARLEYSLLATQPGRSAGLGDDRQDSLLPETDERLILRNGVQFLFKYKMPRKTPERNTSPALTSSSARVSASDRKMTWYGVVRVPEERFGYYFYDGRRHPFVVQRPLEYRISMFARGGTSA